MESSVIVQGQATVPVDLGGGRGDGDHEAIVDDLSASAWIDANVLN